jgi:hypothetical protein
MTTAFLVQHSYVSQDGNEDVKIVGVYSSLDRAESAVGRLGALPGFRDSPSGFSISEYQIDRDHWIEGFTSLGG